MRGTFCKIVEILNEYGHIANVGIFIEKLYYEN